jgi:hypothetical protein
MLNSKNSSQAPQTVWNSNASGIKSRFSQRGNVARLSVFLRSHLVDWLHISVQKFEIVRAPFGGAIKFDYNVMIDGKNALDNVKLQIKL